MPYPTLSRISSLLEEYNFIEVPCDNEDTVRFEKRGDPENAIVITLSRKVQAIPEHTLHDIITTLHKRENIDRDEIWDKYLNL